MATSARSTLPPASRPEKRSAKARKARFIAETLSAATPLRPPGSPVALLHDLEEARGAHAAADAHGHDDVLGLAPAALDEDMAGAARAGHAEGMADRDRAAVDVQLVVGNAELVAAVEHLHGERL